MVLFRREFSFVDTLYLWEVCTPTQFQITCVFDSYSKWITSSMIGYVQIGIIPTLNFDYWCVPESAKALRHSLFFRCLADDVGVGVCPLVYTRSEHHQKLELQAPVQRQRQVRSAEWEIRSLQNARRQCALVPVLCSCYLRNATKPAAERDSRARRSVEGQCQPHVDKYSSSLFRKKSSF